MTEQEWLACTDPVRMVDFLHGQASDRKLRLFACACCRQVWEHLWDQRLRAAVQVCERAADGLGPAGALAAAESLASEVVAETQADASKPRWHHVRESAAELVCLSCGDELDAARLADMLATATDRAVFLGGQEDVTARRREGDSQACWLHDIIGNPFRPAALPPAWRTPTTVALAQAAYDNRTLPAGTLDPAGLTVLADALEEAGCTEAKLLGHLRGGGPHVRGCWVVDLLLGKS